ncbi:hypothetical protein H312_03549 [Anncaliia algerae PRA339]|uniref:Uncharacterized protein n=1 Tax=Anncaliia algerae PRA339 TaxID=1288291 RepID=A0A059EWJ6_9MICR|nr:hypothetical protein H312_03549 [Anncaliia algerae PRA339]
MCMDQNSCISHAPATLNITNQTVRNILKKYKNGDMFLDADRRRRATRSQNHTVFSNADEIICNTIAICNALNLKEIAALAS